MSESSTEPTGHARIDAALEALDELVELPVDRHGEVYDSVHQALREALAGARRDA